MRMQGGLRLPNRNVAAAIIACGFLGSATGARAEGGPLPPASVTITPDPGTATNNNLGLGTATRFIRVSGYGVARARPSDARIVFLVSTAKPNSVVAMKYNDAQVIQVKRGLQLGGVPLENVSSSPAILINPPPVAPAGTTLSGAGTGNNGPETPVDTAPTGGTGSPEGVPNPQSPPLAAGEPQYTAVTRLEVLTHE
ncbi:MAG: hypothetical protein M3Y56_03405, partial [Armatimonadota bacterium]|nr:hypothetical protein [Armatimonadota bacterium]